MANLQIADLVPGKTYNIQVRSTNANGEVSEWSNTHTFVAPPDTSQVLSSIYESQIGSDAIDSGVLKSVTFNGSLNTDFSIKTTSGKINESDAGTVGWAIDYAGNAIFSNAYIRGTLDAGGVIVGKNAYLTYPGLKIDDSNYWYLNGSNQGVFQLGGSNGITYDGSSVVIGEDVSILGGLTTTSLTVGTAPDQVKISNNVNGSSDGIYVTKSGDYWYSDASFRFGGTTGISYTGSGSITIGTSVNVNGNISGASGTIGGFTIGATSLTAGSGSSAVGLDTTGYPFYAGSSTPSSAPFRVTNTGELVATNAKISGEVTATSGSFTGSITSTSGTIGGFTIGATSLTAGSGSNSIGLNTAGYPFYAGNSTPGSAPFRVTSAGILNASGATISGALTATSGSFTGTVNILSGGSLISGDVTDGIVISDLGLVGYDGGLPVFTIPTAANETPTIGNFKIVDTAILSDGNNANLIIGDQLTDNITIRGQVGTGIIPAIFTTIDGDATSYDNNSGFYLDRTGKFKLAGTNGSITMDGSGNLTATGQIKAKSGYIGGESTGWTIESNRMTNSTVGLVAPSTTTRWNYITNPSFETDITHWYFTSNGVKITPVKIKDEAGTPYIDDDNTVHAGNYYAQLTSTSAGDVIGYFTGEKFAPNNLGTGITRVPASAAKNYVFSMYIKASTGTAKSIIAGIKWYDDLDTQINSNVESTSVQTSVGSWIRISVSATAPLTTKSAIPYFKISSATNGQVHFVDAAMFEETSTLNQYFDGNILGGLTRWVGEQDQSQSIYSEYTIYSNSTYANRQAATFGITYDGYLYAQGGEIGNWKILPNSIGYDKSTPITTQYISLNSEDSLFNRPAISVVSWLPTLVWDIAEADGSVSGYVKYSTVLDSDLKVGDTLTVSGFSNSAYNLENVSIYAIDIVHNTFTVKTTNSTQTIESHSSSYPTAKVSNLNKLFPQWVSDHTALYADVNGYVSIGSSLSYDQEGGLSVTGEIQGEQGYIGGVDGWKYDTSGKFFTGEALSFMSLQSRNGSTAGGTASVDVKRVLIDDQFEELAGQLYTNYFAELDLTTLTDYTGLNSPYLSDISLFQYKAMLFNGSPLTGLSGKTLNTKAAYNKRAFFYQSGLAYQFGSATYSSGTTTITFDQVYISNVGHFLIGGGSTGGTWEYPNLSYYVGSEVSGTGIQAGTVMTSYDSATGRAQLSKPTTSSATSSMLDTITVASTKIAATSLKADYIEHTGTVLKIYFKNAAFDSTRIGVSDNYRLSTTNSDTYSLNISVSGSTSNINALNGTTKTITGLKTWDKYVYSGIGMPAYSTIEINDVGTAFSLTAVSSLYVSVPLPANRATLVFYPEDAGLSAHTTGTEGGYGGTGAALTNSFSFYSPYMSSSLYTYLWGGNESEDSAKFSIQIDQSGVNPVSKIKADQFINANNVDKGVPVGTIAMWHNDILPAGWLLCNGNTITNTSYPELYSVIGGTLPNLQGRFPLGVGGTAGKTKGATGGVTNHNHTTDITHGHGHNISVNTHNHSDNFSVNTHNHSLGGSVSNVNVNTTGAGNTFAWNATGATYRYHQHNDNFSVTTNNATNQGSNISGSVSTNSAANQGSNISGSVADLTNTANTTPAVKSTASQIEILPPYYALYFIIYAGR